MNHQSVLINEGTVQNDRFPDSYPRRDNHAFSDAHVRTDDSCVSDLSRGMDVHVVNYCAIKLVRESLWVMFRLHLQCLTVCINGRCCVLDWRPLHVKRQREDLSSARQRRQHFLFKLDVSLVLSIAISVFILWSRIENCRDLGENVCAHEIHSAVDQRRDIRVWFLYIMRYLSTLICDQTTIIHRLYPIGFCAENGNLSNK